MPATILDGKKIAAEIEKEAVFLIKKYGTRPILEFFVVGNDAATDIYIRSKQEACKRTGIMSRVNRLPATVGENTLMNKIEEANTSDATGIIVQLPLPKNIDNYKIAMSISPVKDVDCMHPENIGRLSHEPEILPCTVGGILKFLEEAVINVDGKNIVVINRSHIGKSLSVLLAKMKATVTLCGRNTKLDYYTKNADVIISAAGYPGIIQKDNIKPGAVLIDVGINRNGNKITGDVSNDALQIASFVTPVPGGAGPVTVAMLMKNTAYLAAKQKNHV